jgi:hypothetical protein
MNHGDLRLVQHRDGSLNIANALSSKKPIKQAKEELHLDLKSIKLSGVDISKYNEANGILVDAYITEATSRFKTIDDHMFIGLNSRFELSLIETLRAWGKTFLWSFLFFLPGVIKYINYILTPFVVMFSRKYKRGEVDALEYSTLISKKFFWSIKMWLGLFYVRVPVLFYALFDEYRVLSTHPVAATLVVGLETLVEIIFHFIILNLFIKFLNANEVENGSHV